MPALDLEKIEILLGVASCFLLAVVSATNVATSPVSMHTWHQRRCSEWLQWSTCVAPQVVRISRLVVALLNHEKRAFLVADKSSDIFTVRA